MSKKRIFVGYQLSEKLQQKIGKWQKKHSDLHVRWTPLENLHVTFVPPWYVENVEEIVAALQTMTKPVKAFSIRFETVTLGPENKRPWLMWARGPLSGAFLIFRTCLLTILRREEEGRTPVLHTTLARLDQKQFDTFPDKQFLEQVTWQETVNSFSLIESHLRRTGVVYKTITTIKL